MKAIYEPFRKRSVVSYDINGYSILSGNESYAIDVLEFPRVVWKSATTRDPTWQSKMDKSKRTLSLLRRQGPQTATARFPFLFDGAPCTDVRRASEGEDSFGEAMKSRFEAASHERTEPAAVVRTRGYL